MLENKIKKCEQLSKENANLENTIADLENKNKRLTDLLNN
jgi:cell division protein FtsB